MTAISGDALISLLQSVEQSVTFNWTQITFAVNVQSSQKWSHTFERTYKVELD